MKSVKFVFVMLMMAAFTTLSLSAADFKVGDIKYRVLSGNTVSIENYKKAKGDVKIPVQAMDPKTRTTYKVVAIEPEAMKGCKATSITIPATIEKVGNDAFRKSKNLRSVTWRASCKIPSMAFAECKELRNVTIDNVMTKSIENGAFTGTGITTLVIPGSIEQIADNAFSGCPNLREVNFEESDGDLKLSAAFTGSSVRKLIVNRNIVGKSTASQGLGSVQEIEVGPQASYLNGNVFKGMKGIRTYKFYDVLLSPPYSLNFDEERHKETMKTHDAIIAAMTSSGKVIADDKEYTPAEYAATTDKNAFLEKWNVVLEMASNSPNQKVLKEAYAAINPSQITMHKDVAEETLLEVIDNVYAPKKSYSTGERYFLQQSGNNLIQFIAIDNGYTANSNMETWANADMLRKDIKNDAHKKEYQKLYEIVGWINPNNGGNSDEKMMQLVALCGLGRWQEAAKLFPSVHESVTYRGDKAAPTALTYMQTVIAENGQDVPTPSYTKKEPVKPATRPAPVKQPKQQPAPANKKSPEIIIH